MSSNVSIPCIAIATFDGADSWKQSPMRHGRIMKNENSPVVSGLAPDQRATARVAATPNWSIFVRIGHFNLQLTPQGMKMTSTKRKLSLVCRCEWLNSFSPEANEAIRAPRWQEVMPDLCSLSLATQAGTPVLPN
jgi:hypothetical protein